MKKLLLCAAVLSSLVTMAAPQVRAERQSAVYKVGEDIVFNITEAPENALYRVGDSEKSGEFAKLESSSVTFKAAKPGFVLFELKLPNSKPAVIYGGAAVEPEKIRPGTARPDDFDAFWENELKLLRANPLEVVRKTPVPADKLPAGVVGFDLHVKRGDVVVSGFLTMPAGSKEKSIPARLNFNGASKVSADLRNAGNTARNSIAITFNINFHGIENSFNKVDDTIIANRKKVKNYQYLKADDKQNYAMRKIFLRTVVAADYVMSMPEFNGNLGTYGGSLGGCQSIVCAALVPEVKYCVSTATAMCDHLGADAGHIPGWPRMLADKRTPKGAEKIAPYFDMVNFAPRIKCPVLMAVGFIDVICSPASTYAAYNSLTTEVRQIKHVVTGGHGPVWDSKEQSVLVQGGGVFHKWIRSAR